MSDIPDCICGKPGAYKVYTLPTRLESGQELRGVACEECYRKLLSGTQYAELTEDRLNKENEHGK